MNESLPRLSNCYQSITIGCFIRQMIERIVLSPRVTNYKLPSSTQNLILRKTTLPCPTLRLEIDSTRLDSKGSWKNGRATRAPNCKQLEERRAGKRERYKRLSRDRLFGKGKRPSTFRHLFSFSSPQKKTVVVCLERGGGTKILSRGASTSPRDEFRASCFVFRRRFSLRHPRETTRGKAPTEIKRIAAFPRLQPAPSQFIRTREIPRIFCKSRSLVRVRGVSSAVRCPPLNEKPCLLLWSNLTKHPSLPVVFLLQFRVEWGSRIGKVLKKRREIAKERRRKRSKDFYWFLLLDTRFGNSRKWEFFFWLYTSVNYLISQ